MNSRRLLLVFVLVAGYLFAYGQAPRGYQLPPQIIIDMVDAPSTPSMSFSPNNNVILLISSPEQPTIQDVGMEELRLGGIRFDPNTFGPSRGRFGSGLQLSNIEGTVVREVSGLPASPRISNTRWSPDGNKVAFCNTTDTGIELWVLDVNTASAKKLNGPLVNDIMGTAMVWLSDNNTIVYSSVPENRGPAPTRPRVASGPIAQESLGRRAAVRTFQDLLTDKYDEDIFEYYVTNQLIRITLDGQVKKIGEPRIVTSFSDSPDGKYLIVTTMLRPFSFIVPANRFPQKVELLDIDGRFIRLLADIPLTDALPQGLGATRTGARSFTWRADAPATLYWVEALDGGDPAVEAEYRDQIFVLDAPFTGNPTPSFKLQMRYSGISWGRGDFALINESWRRDRIARVHVFNPDDHSKGLSLMMEVNMEDRYNEPGNIQTTLNQYGRSVLHFDRRGRKLLLFGNGASPEGNRPFVDEYDIRTGKTDRLWRSEAPYFENPLRVLDMERGLIITTRQSVDQRPNYFIRDLRRNRLTQITDLPDPSEHIKNMGKELIHYERNDGIPLSGTLYLPEGFRPGIDAPLPTILWAYPREFKSADAAGQVTGSPYTYTRLGATSVVMLVTQGYAVLDNASFPIVGEGEMEPNDTFVEQLVANAEAAINKLVEMGVTDPRRVGVSGHSYGAFMTANLLTHSDLFAAGVARSGAYNRTLTPFGFQAEERTYWQAPDVYNMMSPFMHADKMKTPLLLIHGADDNNSGTFPIQSERYYDALRGNGAITRLVMLPHESHGYAARESILHMHYEWIQWFDRYVKNRK